MLRLTFYTRAGCHLCEAALEAMLPLLRGRAELDVVDIDTDAALRQTFDQRIPVLCHDENIIFEGPVQRAALIALLTQGDL